MILKPADENDIIPNAQGTTLGYNSQWIKTYNTFCLDQNLISMLIILPKFRMNPSNICWQHDVANNRVSI